MTTPLITYKLYNVTEVMKQSIKETVEYNIANKMDSYFTKVTSGKDNAKIMIDVKIERNKKNKYNGKVLFLLDGMMYHYHTSANKPFNNVLDLVAHAFDHCKQELADK